MITVLLYKFTLAVHKTSSVWVHWYQPGPQSAVGCRGVRFSLGWFLSSFRGCINMWWSGRPAVTGSL